MIDDYKNFRGYAWMPAASDYSLFGGLAAYVRYKRPQKQPIYVRQRSPWAVLLDCPDRDLLLLKAHADVEAYVPPPGVWDRCVSFSNFMPHSFEDAYLPFHMVNYTAATDDKSPRSRIHRTREPKESFIVSDSGGFQLRHGRIANLDPVKLGQWYNENVDLGMVLDIPISGIGLPMDKFKRICEAQAVNTEILMQNKRPDLELINIMHGQTDEEWQTSYDLCHRDDINRMALGGTYASSFLQSMGRIFDMVEKTRKDGYWHYHILGVWNLLQVIPFMRMQAKNYVPLLTSDSSTHVQNGNARNYAFHPSLDSRWQLKPIGYRAGFPLNPEDTLPCSCPVCETLKYSEIFSVMPGALTTFLLMQHNQFAMNNYVRKMRDPVAELSTKELQKLMTAQVGDRRGFTEAVRSIDFVDNVLEHGLERTKKRYTLGIPLASDCIADNGDMTGLFDLNDATDVESVAAEDDYYTTLHNRLEGLAEQYLSKAKIENHGKKVKEQATKKGLKVTIAKERKQAKVTPK